MCYLIFFSTRAEQACVTLDFEETGLLSLVCDLFVARLEAYKGSLKTSHGSWSLE